VLRSLRALALLWIILSSYALAWSLSRLFGRTFLERAHEKNARRLATGFSELRGVFIKMGQVMSVLGSFLPRAYGVALERLQDKVPPRPFSEVRGRLVESLGPDALARFESFSETPIAAASLAQVHRARLHDGRDVAVKVLYPGIEKLIRRDLAVLWGALPLLKWVVPMSRFERLLEQLSAMLARETDYGQERRNMDRIRAIFADREDIVVPKVVEELSAGAVLTMTYEHGVKVTDFPGLDAAGIEREGVARILVECYFDMLLEHRVFHADPHPGNFLVRPGPTLVILDYGAVEEVTDALAEGMRTVLLGGLARDAERVLEGLERMGFVAPGGDRALLQRVGREYLGVLGSVRIDDYSKLDRNEVEKLTGFEQVRGRLREIMRNVQYPEGYFYVERTLVLLFGLVGQLAPKAGLPGLAAPYASRALLRSFASTSSAPESGVPTS
jgi:ubiquinone biosynthesis protein